MRRVAVLLAVLSSVGTVRAQGTKADYERAARLGTELPDGIRDLPGPPQWIDGGPRFWYGVRRKDGYEYIAVDPILNTKAPAFDAKKLAAALAAGSGEKVEATELPIDRLRLDGNSVRFRAFDEFMKFDGASGTLTKEKGPPPRGKKLAPHPDSQRSPYSGDPISPDGKWEASVEDFNLTVKNRDTDDVVLATKDGAEKDFYESEFFWSPDSSKLFVFQVLAAKAGQIHLVESAPGDRFLPKVHKLAQPKPGDKLNRRVPRLFHPADDVEVPIDAEPFANPHDLSHVHWDADSNRVTLLNNPRGHASLTLESIDAYDGRVKPVFVETSKTFVDYNGKLYLHPFDETGELIWMSERDGWNHLYLMDSATGLVKNKITKGEWVVRRVDRMDAADRKIWFWAHGVRPGQDPYHLHYCRCDLDGRNLVVLTAGDGTHEVWISPDRTYFVDQYSRVDLKPVVELRRMDDGKLVLTLETATAPEYDLAFGRRNPERFVAKGRDGKTDIHGVIYRPSNFDPKKSYPVVQEIYAGPTHFWVPKRFRAWNDSIQPLVETGVIGVVIDGMGSNWRSKAFHDVCWKNLSDAGFPDSIAWLRAAAAKYPELDLNRVGIFGSSAGGRNAVRALIDRHDFYKVAVADCGNHDDRLFHQWYGELWMGYPVNLHYYFQSNITQAHRLEGKLLLTVGELDRNVDPANTLRLVDALSKADKDFEMYVAPGHAHGAVLSPAVSRRQTDFFVRHLLGVEPRAK